MTGNGIGPKPGDGNRGWHREADAADGFAFTATDLQSFLNRVDTAAPGPVKLRAATSHRGDIQRVCAHLPIPDDTMVTEPPDDVLHDAAMPLGAIECGDAVVAFLLQGCKLNQPP